MSSLPPYENNNPYIPPTQYASSGEPVSNPYAPPTYPPTDPYTQPPSYANPAYGQPAPMYAQQQYIAVPMQMDDPGSGQALAGMILGIAGLFLSFFGLVPLLGLIFSIIGMRSTTRKGMAVAGLVLSVIGLLFAILFTFLIIAAIIAAVNTPTY